MVDAVYLVVLCGAAIAVIARGVIGGRNRVAWLLVGAGLGSWAVGDLFYEYAFDPETGAYPSVADGFYIAFYVLALAGLRRLGRRPQGRDPITPPLLTSAFGLATLWAWLVFSPVLGSVEGSAGAVATTLAYPFLDLLLLFAAIGAMAANDWRPHRPLLMLVAGIVTIGLTDLVYSAQVANGTYTESTVLDLLWPAGAALIAAAAWLRQPVQAEPREQRSDGLLARGMPIAAMLLALGILLLDHYSRLDTTTVLLASMTLFAATLQLVLLYRRQAAGEHRELELQELHAASARASLDAIVTADAAGRVREWNDAARRMFGYTRERALGRRVAELIVPRARRSEHADPFAGVTGGDAPEMLGRRMETTVMRSDGSEFPVELTIAEVATESPMWTAFIRDISDRRHQEEQRERLATMANSTEDAMLSATLDGVVIAWNTAAERLYGYTAQEAMGQKLVDRLVPPERIAEFREMFGRVAAGESVAYETQRRRRDGEMLDISLRGFPIRDEFGVVTGIATVVRDMTDKRRRERREREDREHQAWTAQIEDALEGDYFEFHGQPVINLRGGEVTHHELLLRLRMNGELIPPGRFLPHAERSALMRRIDRWAIRKGIELASEHPVAINLSAKSLGDAGLISAIERSLASSGADPRDVTFEITETAAAENLDAARSLVGALRQIGCGVALDDFGTGYGSFTYLKHLPVTELKIDIDFIRDLADDPADQRIVRAILAVARNFGLLTVAEGVEDERTLALLREMGVDCAQGYLIGRPTRDWTSAAGVPNVSS